jgi:hypothetical protein
VSRSRSLAAARRIDQHQNCEEELDDELPAKLANGWRQIRMDTGLDWVTPHTFRKTAALIAERMDAETAAKQLGYSSPVIPRQFYISKPTIAADVAHVLDELAQRARPTHRQQMVNRWSIATSSSNAKPALTQRFRWSEPVSSVGLTGFEPATP